MIKLYTLPSNTSSRKARAFLENLQVTFKETPMQHVPLSFDEFKEIVSLTRNGVEDLISPKTKVYKQLVEEDGIDFDELSLKELHYIVQRHPNLLRAPITIKGETMTVGFKEEEFEAFVPRSVRRARFNKILQEARAYEDEEIKEHIIRKPRVS